MIFDTEKKKDVEQIGDIKNNNVSIDTNNIDFIVTILSTNLYSKPIESFIRETVSNAWDSHIEAGVDDPVILELGEDTEGKKFCRIQDFGVGLSPERFDSVYKNIGSSTKRSDNTQIGGFGIGRFSALAYSDVVHITSVHEGKKYIYMMYKDGNSISIDMLHNQDTTERNGLEVKLEIQEGDFNNFAKSIKSQLVYFENLYIIDSTKSDDYNYKEDIEKDYNNFSIKKFNHFWTNTLDDTKEMNLVLGKVRYPLRVENLDKPYPNKIAEYPISLKLNIGDLEVTPNREEVLYSAKNKKVIEDKLDLALLEIQDLTDKEKTKDYTKISEYLEAINNKQYLILMSTDSKTVKIKISDSKKNLTLNGESFDSKNFMNMYNHIMRYPAINSSYNFRDNQIKYVGHNLSLSEIKEKFSNIYLSDLGNVKNITKRYIRETFNDNSFFVKDDKSITYYIKTYIQRLKDIVDDNIDRAKRGYSTDKFEYDHKAFKVIFKHVIKNMNKLKTFNDSKVPHKWIADTKAADKAKRGLIKKQGFDWKQNINVHELRFKDYGGGVMTDSKPHKMKDLSKKFKSLTVYAEKDNSKLRDLFKYFRSGVKPNMIEVAPTKIKLLDNVDNFVTVEDFMSTEYKLIRNVGTVEYLRRELPFLKDLAKIDNLSSVSENLALTVDKLDQFVRKYEAETSHHLSSATKDTLVGEIYDICVEKDYFNEEIRGLFNKHKQELINAEILITFASKAGGYSYSTTSIPETRVNLVVDYLLARKLIRPSIKAVLKLKKETIFNIKEDEDN